MKQQFTTNELYQFIDKAGKSTYAGGGKREQKPERPGFIELIYSEGDWFYRDSYTGFYRSRGMEVVRYKDQPVWTASYGGGMIEGRDNLADETFTFLKKVMSTDEEGFESFRGPHNFKDGDWDYKYDQEGDINEFHGYEEIHFKGELVFFHRMIGGIVKGRDGDD